VDLEAQNCQPARLLDRGTALHLTSYSPLSQMPVTSRLAFDLSVSSGY
jgi:hypothetical protein